MPGTDRVETMAHNTLLAAREAMTAPGGQQQGSQCGNNHVMRCSRNAPLSLDNACCCHNAAMGSLNRQFCDSPILKGFYSLFNLHLIWSLYYVKVDKIKVLILMI